MKFAQSGTFISPSTPFCEWQDHSQWHTGKVFLTSLFTVGQQIVCFEAYKSWKGYLQMSKLVKQSCHSFQGHFVFLWMQSQFWFLSTLSFMSGTNGEEVKGKVVQSILVLVIKLLWIMHTEYKWQNSLSEKSRGRKIAMMEKKLHCGCAIKDKPLIAFFRLTIVKELD